jgi:hypothetical protein
MCLLALRCYGRKRFRVADRRGSGGGAADGGRDLEAHFYTPGADSEIESQTWWIECKGRTGTVEAGEVKSTIVNAEGKGGLDYIVIVTNSQFSNPTRDWVKDWQIKHPRPKVKLWDQAHLERLLSRHPDVVLRLFSEALSLQGRFHAMESRFWNKLEFVTVKTLSDLWKVREEIELTAMGVFAAVVNEFANGDITYRPWGSSLWRSLFARSPAYSIDQRLLSAIAHPQNRHRRDADLAYLLISYLVCG